MSDQELCNLLNEFYEDIRQDLADSVFSAIKAAQSSNEFVSRPEIFGAIRSLILDLSNPQQDDDVAVNRYMTNIITRGSSTLRFFNPPVGFPSPLPSFLPTIGSASTRAELFLSQPTVPVEPILLLSEVPLPESRPRAELTSIFHRQK